MEMEHSSLGLAFIAGIALLWLLPVLFIIGSGKTTWIEKITWLLAVIFVSWFAWIFYMPLAPVKNKN